MASKIPTFTQGPVFTPQKVISRSSGYEALGNTLGNIAKSSFDVARKIKDDESNAIYLQTVSNIEQLHSDTQLNLVSNPAQFQKITENFKHNLNSLVSNAQVSKTDRNKLNLYATKTIGAVSLSGAKVGIKQARVSAQNTYFENRPNQLQAFQDLLIEDPDKAKGMMDDLVTGTNNAFAAGVITRTQRENGLKDIHGIIDHVQSLHKLYNSDDVTAKDYHCIPYCIIVYK